ncbi:unnamed protein product, partial [Laminaria digitata]
LTGESVSLNCRCPCTCGRGGGGGDISSAAGGGGGGGGRGSRAARVGRGGASADLSRVEQLVGGAAMLRGCALGVEFLARVSERSPEFTVREALDAMDAALGEGEGDGLEALTRPFVKKE